MLNYKGRGEPVVEQGLEKRDRDMTIACWAGRHHRFKQSVHKSLHQGSLVAWIQCSHTGEYSVLIGCHVCINCPSTDTYWVVLVKPSAVHHPKRKSWLHWASVILCTAQDERRTWHYAACPIRVISHPICFFSLWLTRRDVSCLSLDNWPI